MASDTIFKKGILKYIFTILFLFQAAIFAQSGTLKGHVFDKTTKDPLIGASVVIKGTSLGAAVDFNGVYTIHNLPAGKRTVTISYIGYKPTTEEVTIEEGKTNNQDFYLESEAMVSQTVTVTAQAEGQLAAINQQLTSNTIKNVISAEKIHELPDDNAAAALSRLPGVSLMNGDQIVIRGVEAKLNQVMINGIQLPSTDMNTRSTGIGFISSNMLSGIEVIKAITPDMDANTIGGVVNLRLREAPENLHFDFLSQGNYNYSDRTADNFKFWASVSNRFFNNKLGVFLQGNADRSNIGDQVVSTGWGQTGEGDQTYGNAVYQMDNATLESQSSININNGGSLILDYVLPNGKIVFQNTYAHNLLDNRFYKDLLRFSNSDDVAYTMYRDHFGRDLWVNALQLENQFGNLKVEASLSHSYTNKYTRARYGDDGANFEFNNEKNIPGGVWGNGITYVKNRPKDIAAVFSIYDNMNPMDADSAWLAGWVTAKREEFFQHVYNASADFSLPVAFTDDLTATFKAGGKYTRTTRDNDVTSFFTGSTDGDTYATVHTFFPGVFNDENHRLMYAQVRNMNYKRGQYYMNDEFNFKNGGFKYAFNSDLLDNWYEAAMPGWQPAQKFNESTRDDFNGAEQFSAGYAMGTFDLFAKMTLITGLRYERYNMKYKANFVYVTHNVYGDAIVPDTLNTVDRSDENIFPNVQLRYKFNDWSDIRFAYTKGISRPDYNAIIPKTYIDFNRDITVGNTKLRPTISDNLDLNVSFYNNEIGLLTVGGFYKKLHDVFYNTSIYYKQLDLFPDISVPSQATLLALGFKNGPTAGNSVFGSLNNTNPGYVHGFELDWQTTFWYLPFPLNSLVLNANYTKSYSKMDYRIVRKINTKTMNPVTHKWEVNYFTVDTIFTERLPQQAEDVVNAALGIDYKGFSGRISFNMRGNVINFVGSRPEESSYTGNIYRWDFTIKQNLPIEGLSVALNGVNIFHNPVYSYRKFREALGAAITENLVSIRYSPTIYQFNIRYNF